MKFRGWWLSKAEDGSTASIEFIELDETELDPERDWSVAAESDERRMGVVMNAHGLAVMLDFLMALAPADESEPVIEGWQFIDDSARLARLIANEEVVTEVARFRATGGPGIPDA